MGTEAYLVSDSHRVAYDLGKFLGMWVDVDWSRCEPDVFAARIREVWSDEDPLDPVYPNALAAVLYRFCVDHYWAVHVVHEDFFFDDARLDTEPLETLFASPEWPVVYAGFDAPTNEARLRSVAWDAKHATRPEYRLLGSRWPFAAYQLGRGYDLPDDVLENLRTLHP